MAKQRVSAQTDAIGFGESMGFQWALSEATHYSLEPMAIPFASAMDSIVFLSEKLPPVGSLVFK